MESEQLRLIAQQLLDGSIRVEEFVTRMEHNRTHQLDEVSVDIDRQARCGFPEVIYGQGKTVATIAEIARTLHAKEQNVLATRVDGDMGEELVRLLPEGTYNEIARTFRWESKVRSETTAKVAIVTAGTSDLPVAEETRETLGWMGVETDMIRDVGVAGPHRLKEQLPRLTGADVIVVVAGMEGALPSVVGGYVSVPVVAVPTSVGYGANFGGLSALLGMLNSCSSNVTVVNIDAGFKAAYVAGLIATNTARARGEGK